MKSNFGSRFSRALAMTGVLLLAVPALYAQKKQKPVRMAEVTKHANSSADSSASAATKSSNEYVIGATDVLSIDVWKEPEISQVETVRPDGKITLPLVGEIEASGKTPRVLQKEIARKLSAYIQQPAVTVIVQQPKSHKFNIIGSVLRPGTYPLGEQMTVLDAIAAAGGFGEFAKVTQIYVVRTLPNGTSTRIRFNYKDAVRGNQRYLNLKLKPGDTIIVP